MIAIPPCAVCVAPVDGRPRLLLEPGSPVERGQVVAVVDSNGRSEPVRSHVRGRLGGGLGAAAVRRGEGVVWRSR